MHSDVNKKYFSGGVRDIVGRNRERLVYTLMGNMTPHGVTSW
jgi:hypothetical protein